MDNLFSMDALCVYAGLGANGGQESTNEQENNDDNKND